MSSVLERPRTGAAKGSALTGRLPQVNLLPPEVRAARGLKVTQRWLGIGLVVTVAVCAGAFGVATIQSANATSDLTTAQAETTRLQQEQAKYAAVPQVLADLSNTEAAITFGGSTEVQWKSYLDAVVAVMPEGVSIDRVNFVGATPMAPQADAAAPTDGSTTPVVGELSFTLRSRFVPNTADWIDQMNGLTGFSDAWAAAANLTEDEHGIYYTVDASVQVSDLAYSHRFDKIEGEG